MWTLVLFIFVIMYVSTFYNSQLVKCITSRYIFSDEQLFNINTLWVTIWWDSSRSRDLCYLQYWLNGDNWMNRSESMFNSTYFIKVRLTLAMAQLCHRYWPLRQRWSIFTPMCWCQLISLHTVTLDTVPTSSTSTNHGPPRNTC